MRGFRGVALGLVITAMIGGIAYSYLSSPSELETFDMDNTGPRVVALSILTFVFMASLIFGQQKVRDILKGTLFWGGLLMLLVAGYTFRHDLVQGGYRMLGALAPGLAVSQPDGTVLVVKDVSGHFSLDASVNGAKTRFMLDTGASTVVLTYKDALQAGFDPADLSFSVPVQTANGRALVAPARIDTLSINTFQLTDVRAFVARDGALDTSLFGMSALDRLSSWRIEGDRLIMTR